ncbi:MAG: hypothetical protein HYY93_00650 [Planctomycetes bacterium]|nr:hypothetical protein [Planctomycetota bacterium]
MSPGPCYPARPLVTLQTPTGPVLVDDGWLDLQTRESIRRSIESEVLPSGFTVLSGQTSSGPPGWFANANMAGYELRVRGPSGEFTLWLFRHYISQGAMDPPSTISYWERLLGGEETRIITDCPDISVREHLRLLPAVTMSPRMQERFREAVGTALGAGWEVIASGIGECPEGWRSTDGGSVYRVEAGHGSEKLTFWFVPRDWIGIRTVQSRAMGSYSDGIYENDLFEVIVDHTDYEWDQKIRNPHLGNSTPSLVNGGFRSQMLVCGSRLREVDSAAAELVRRHCHGPDELCEAARSLVALGVPARTVFLRAVREVWSMEQHLFSGALGLLGGDDSITALCDLLEDSTQDDENRKYIVYALRGHLHPRIGPALQKSLREVETEEPLAAIAAVIAGRGYAPAGQDLLEVMKRVGFSYYGGTIARAVALLHVPGAELEIGKIAEGCRQAGRPSADFETALRLLSSDWGEPGPSVRLLLVPPESPRHGLPMEVVVHAEILSAKAAGERLDSSCFWLGHGSELFVDGKKVADRSHDFGGISQWLRVGDIQELHYDLSRHISEAGRHTLEFTALGSHSKVCAIDVRAVR